MMCTRQDSNSQHAQQQDCTVHGVKMCLVATFSCLHRASSVLTFVTRSASGAGVWRNCREGLQLKYQARKCCGFEAVVYSEVMTACKLSDVQQLLLRFDRVSDYSICNRLEAHYLLPREGHMPHISESRLLLSGSYTAPYH